MVSLYFLGVPAEKMREHYKELVKLFHPDLHGGNANYMSAINQEFQFITGGGAASVGLRFLGTPGGEAVECGGGGVVGKCESLQDAIRFSISLPDDVSAELIGVCGRSGELKL